MNWDKSCNDSFHAMLLSCIDSFSLGKQVLRNVKSVLNPSCPVKVQSKSKENQNLNQKEKIKKRIVFVQRYAFLLVFKALHTSYFAKMHKIGVSILLKCIKLAFLFC